MNLASVYTANSKKLPATAQLVYILETDLKLTSRNSEYSKWSTV